MIGISVMKELNQYKEIRKKNLCLNITNKELSPNPTSNIKQILAD